MKTLLATLAAVGALTAVAAPAAAQPWRHHDRGHVYDLRSHSLGRLAMTRVSDAADRGALSRREAWRLQAEARDLYQTEARLGGNGLDPRERHYVQRRFDRIMAKLDRDVRDGRHYGYGYYR